MKHDVSHKMVLSKHFTWKNLWCIVSSYKNRKQISHGECCAICWWFYNSGENRMFNGWFKKTCCGKASIWCMHDAHARIYNESTQNLIYFVHMTKQTLVDLNPSKTLISIMLSVKYGKMWAHYVQHTLLVKNIQCSVGSKSLRSQRKCFCVPINNPVQVLIWSPSSFLSSVIKPKMRILCTREKKARTPAVCEFQQSLDDGHVSVLPGTIFKKVIKNLKNHRFVSYMDSWLIMLVKCMEILKSTWKTLTTHFTSIICNISQEKKKRKCFLG